jgi:hypothetical protein
MKGTEENAIGFIGAVDPKVMLLMPGCKDIMVNQPHGEVFEAEFNSLTKSKVVRTREEFEDVIQTAQAESTSTPDTTDYASLTCYCEKNGAITALSQKHCPFESLYSRLKKGGERSWEQDLAFLNLQQNGSRRYDVFGLCGQRVVRNGYDFLEARLFPLAGLRLEVLSSKGKLPPTEMKVTADFGGVRTILSETCKVREETLYHSFDNVLREAGVEVRKGIPNDSAMANAIEKLGNIAGMDYAAADAILHLLFEPSKESSYSISQKITQLRERLFDSLVVFENIQARIKEIVDHPQQWIQEFSLDSRLQLLRWTLPAETIELEECYSWMRRQNPLIGQGKSNRIFEKIRQCLAQEQSTFDKKVHEIQVNSMSRFVAVSEGKVLDHDDDEMALAVRVAQLGKEKPVLIQELESTGSIDASFESAEEVFDELASHHTTR